MMRPGLLLLLLVPLIYGCNFNRHFYNPTALTSSVEQAEFNTPLALKALLESGLSATPNHSLSLPAVNHPPKKSTALLDESIPIQIASSSGNRLEARLLLSQAPYRHGLILHFHGSGGNINHSAEKISWLVNYGFDLLLFDYSGYGRSGGAPDARTLRQDSHSVLQLFNRIAPESPGYSRVLMGTSLGGIVLIDALDTLAQPIRKDIVIIDSAFHSYSDQAIWTVQQYPLSRWLLWSIPLAIDDHYSPKSTVKTISPARSLFLHCRNDQVVPYQFGMKLYTLIESSKSFWLFEDCRHARAITPDNPEIQLQLVKFLFNQSVAAPTSSLN